MNLASKNISYVLNGKTVLNDISFQLDENEHLLLLGASGSGKTVLAKALSGQINYDVGHLNFNQNNNEIKPIVTLVEQHYNYGQLSNDRVFYYQQRYTGFDANEAITLAKSLAKYSAAEVEILLKEFNLLHLANSPQQQFSSGEYKKSQLIKALLQKPDVLILDEPFVGLDIQTRQTLKERLSKLAQNGVTIILICPPTDIPAFITQIAELDEGKLIQFSPLKNAQTAHIHPQHPLEYTPVPPFEVKQKFEQIIRMKNVSVSYGEKQILKNINWEVKQGEKWLLRGPNGAGKSTLLSLINGDNPQAYANDVVLFDRKRGSGETIWDIKSKIGHVSPELQWYFNTNTTVFQAVASGLFDTIGLNHALTTPQQKQVRNWLDAFGLETVADAQLSSISAGMQRLTLLARAAVKCPPLLVLDEPCQGMDELQKEHFLNLVSDLCQHNNCTLIYVSHYANEIPDCISHVIELENGHATTKIIQEKILAPTIKTTLETA